MANKLPVVLVAAAASGVGLFLGVRSGFFSAKSPASASVPAAQVSTNPAAAPNTPGATPLTARLQARVEYLERELLAARREVEELRAALPPVAAASSPSGSATGGAVVLPGPDGKPLGSYDPVHRVLHVDLSDAVILQGDARIFLGRKREIAGGLRSVGSEVKAGLKFENERAEDVILHWIDYNGNPIPWDRVPPGGTSVRPTYMTHPWVVTDLNGNRLGEVKPELAEQTEVIPITK